MQTPSSGLLPPPSPLPQLFQPLLRLVWLPPLPLPLPLEWGRMQAEVCLLQPRLNLQQRAPGRVQTQVAWLQTLPLLSLQPPPLSLPQRELRVLCCWQARPRLSLPLLQSCSPRQGEGWTLGTSLLRPREALCRGEECPEPWPPPQ